MVLDGGGDHAVAAAPVAKVIDTTGAGDQYAAGFLFGFTRGRQLADVRAARHPRRRRGDLPLRAAPGDAAARARREAGL